MNVSKYVNLDDERNILLHQDGEVKLTEKEKQLLVLLLTCKDTTGFARKEDIRHTIWPERHGVVPEGSIVQLVYRLRKVLRYCGLEGCIKTVSREGYRLIVDDLTIVDENKSLKCGNEINHKKKWMTIKFLFLILLPLSIVMFSFNIVDKFVHCPDGVEIQTQISTHPWIVRSHEICKITTENKGPKQP